jgi:hypothetical protein
MTPASFRANNAFLRTDHRHIAPAGGWRELREQLSRLTKHESFIGAQMNLVPSLADGLVQVRGKQHFPPNVSHGQFLRLVREVERDQDDSIAMVTFVSEHMPGRGARAIRADGQDIVAPTQPNQGSVQR